MVVPFRIAIADGVLADLRDRLRRTRWPEPETAPGWTQGPPLDYVRDLCRYWSDGYDWRATEARLNALPQFRTPIGGLQIHFVHVRSARPDAIPIVLTHGWPGSVIEFEKVIGPLSADFHLVIPSLPGYGFSDRPATAGWTVQRIADAWAELMGGLGYERFVASGHDWGTSVSTEIGKRHPERVIGLHLVPPLAPPPGPVAFDDSGDAYSHLQSTRPQTIGYGLVDSPALLCAWIVEKFQAWTDCGGDLSTVLTRDELLDNLMLYWLTGTGAAAGRLYWESFAEVRTRFRGGGTPDVVTVPVGGSIFPAENPRPSRESAARRFTDIRYWSEPPRGGHFAAFEQPVLFTQELQSCVRALTLDRPSARPPGRTPVQPPAQAPGQPPDQAADQTPAEPADQTPIEPADQTPTEPADQTPTEPADQTPTEPADQTPAEAPGQTLAEAAGPGHGEGRGQSSPGDRSGSPAM